MINITDKSKCTGCSACKSICPTKAIEFCSDTAGFNYPKVDMNKCVNCSACEKVCPIINPLVTENNFKEPIIKAAWNLNEEVRINSTSGGVFSALAEKFIEDGGCIAAAEYTDDFNIVHSVIFDKDSIKKHRQSKYAQSDLKSVFVEIKNILKQNQKVMFCGTPCQVAGLKKYLQKDYDNLFTVDFICRGIISQKIYKNYLDSVEKHSNAKITKVHFKNKDFGWNRFSTKLSLNDGSVYQKDRDNDEYMVGYLKYNLYIRPCCHDCKYKTLPRVSDISLGDFWGIGLAKKELDNNKGTSVIIINSDKGKVFFDKTKEVLYFEDSNIEQVIKGNSCLLNITPKGVYSDYFYNKFEKVDFIDLIHKIDRKALWDRKDLSVKSRIYIVLQAVKRKLVHK